MVDQAVVDDGPLQQGLDGGHDLGGQGHAEGGVDGAPVGHEERPQPPDPAAAARRRRLRRGSGLGRGVGRSRAHRRRRPIRDAPGRLRRRARVGVEGAAQGGQPVERGPAVGGGRRWSSTLSRRAATGSWARSSAARPASVISRLTPRRSPSTVDPAHQAVLDQPVEHAGQRRSADPGQGGDAPGPLGRRGDQRQHAELRQRHLVERPLEHARGHGQGQAWRFVQSPHG